MKEGRDIWGMECNRVTGRLGRSFFSQTTFSDPTVEIEKDFCGIKQSNMLVSSNLKCVGSSLLQSNLQNKGSVRNIEFGRIVLKSGFKETNLIFVLCSILTLQLVKYYMAQIYKQCISKIVATLTK